MLIPKPVLFFGPLSNLSVAAIYKYSHERQVPLGLTCSLNQINYKGGYTGWTTESFVEYCEAIQEIYPDAQIALERDHAGPGFMPPGTDIQELFNNLQTDVMLGFHNIHVDFCHSEDPLGDSKRVVQYLTEYASIKNRFPISFAVGTDENTGRAEQDLDKVYSNLGFFKSFCNPDWYVVNTGSLTLDGLQVGKFNARSTSSINDMLLGYQIKLREHNADYLTPSEIQRRVGVVNGMNVAPELGTTQSEIVLDLCDKYDIDTKEWRDVCVGSGKWKKWLSDPNTIPTHRHITKLCGHYNFQTPEYEALIEQLDKYVDTTEIIVANLYKVVERYDTNFNRGTRYAAY